MRIITFSYKILFSFRFKYNYKLNLKDPILNSNINISILEKDILASFARTSKVTIINFYTWIEKRLLQFNSNISALVHKCFIDSNVIINSVQAFRINKFILFIVIPNDYIDNFNIWIISFDPFQNVLSESIHMNKNFLVKSLFIFKNNTWSNIVNCLKEKNI